MDINVVHVDSKNIDFKKLIKFLDEELSKRYGQVQIQYNKHNNIDHINDVVIVYKDKLPISCGAFKEYDNDSVELKRIFVLDKHRGEGLAKLIVFKLEEIARKRNYKYVILETGKGQPEAIGLYKGLGYEVIPNYGPYKGNANSLCMKKVL